VSITSTCKKNFLPPSHRRTENYAVKRGDSLWVIAQQHVDLPFGWWLNTTLMWTSTTCGPDRDHIARSCPSIASNAAILHVLLQNGAGIHGGLKLSVEPSAARTSSSSLLLAAIRLSVPTSRPKYAVWPKKRPVGMARARASAPP